MAELDLSLLEDLDVEDLISLPKGFRYELHSGNLVIMTPSTFWHEDTTRRLLLMLHAAGLNAYQDPGVRGDRPRDCHRLALSGGAPAYVRERTVLLSELEIEYRSKQA
jgi:hypothetical protein